MDLFSEIKGRIDELRGLISQYDKAYYQDAESLIPDREYDLLFAELVALEQENPQYKSPDSPTQRVGGKALGKFESVTHQVPMLSLQNTYNRQEVEDFHKRISKEIGSSDIEFCCELKIDGVAVSITYESGILKTGATRGDGYTGDNITQNIKTVRSVPISVKGNSYNLTDFEVRGEAYMNVSDFDEINKERLEAGEKLYANPRNTTAGSLKLLDPQIVSNRKINIFTYYLRTNDVQISKHSQSLDILKDIGFQVNPAYQTAKNIDEIFEFINHWETERHNLPFQTDGIVIKVNSFRMQEELGTVARSPKWAIAYKYETESAETLLKNITLQVGRTGAVTPVAELEPVLLAGSTISRATLHNYDFIKEKDIRIGDTVIIEKGGEVIPKVVSYIPNLRLHNSSPYIFPDKCSCSLESTLVRIEGEANYYCIHPECPWQIRRSIEHFASRDAMDIEGFGEKVVEQFVELGYIRNIADIYKLHEYKDEILALDRWGDKSVSNLLEAIENSKIRPFERVLYGLGIRFIGQGGAKLLARNFKNIEQLRSATKEKLEEIHEVGEKMADSVVSYFADSKNIEIIDRLISYGLNMESVPASEVNQNINITGKTFVFTGELESMSRGEAAKRVEEFGGKEVKSVSKNTDYVVVGTSPGSKYDKALKLGTKILNEEEFLNLLNTTN
ncbi:MAG: NAD-dependent DNA ligase LigA [Candidatus Kapabacteria bacterium]|nr:NAD-dependent DNA ligase LigA [Ignavibacteriota bacterium]MCW5885978.1 NAD-dependent DNA ligase LigA [Candidatus Kapabacteria bacterium]